MSLSDILQQVQRKGRLPVGQASAGKESVTKQPNNGGGVKVDRNTRDGSQGQRVVDPVVARLKAARKLEMEKKEQAKRDKMGQPSKKLVAKIPMRKAPAQPQTRRNDPRTKGNRGVTPTASGRNPASSSTTPTAPPKKKMKFNELMKKASQIDHSKLSITPTIRPKSTSTTPPIQKRPTVASKRPPPPPPPPSSRPVSSKRPPTTSSTTASKRPPGVPGTNTRPSGPLPIRKPSSALERKLNSKKNSSVSSSRVGESTSYGYSDYESDSADSFIVDDEEEETAAAAAAAKTDYDRDEIWAIFNRGKKRSHYEYDDYDSDDMEATGAEVLEEERRSKRNAELEDRREWEEEQRRAEEKRRRKR
ncbi:protein Spt2p [[Candida] anglica]|uniref:Protein Spt2p n=1 Tax=[Candida] anglica TaxID=148631 RepID=A0ABP0EE48_9ASCO